MIKFLFTVVISLYCSFESFGSSGTGLIERLDHSLSAPITRVSRGEILMDIPSRILGDLTKEERQAKVENYFTDHVAEEVGANSDFYSFRIFFPGNEVPGYHIDSQIKEGFSVLGKPLSMVGVPFHYEENSSDLAISCNDNWTLYSWSQLVRSGRLDPKRKIVILHLDDHRDDMPPRLLKRDEGLLDPFSGYLFDLRDPESVKACIETAAIGIGSFIGPFVFSCNQVEVRHLCARENPFIPHDTWKSIEEGTILDEWRVDAVRLKVNLMPCSDTSPRRYLLTNDLNILLGGINPDAQIILHMDMDYFNDRFDGDSMWEERKRQHNPSKEEVMASIHNFFYQMKERGILPRVIHNHVGLCPGFYPYEFWEESLSIISSYMMEGGK